MPEGFIHSIKVPRLYKTAAKIVKDVQENQASVKSLIFDKHHPNVSGVYALTLNTLNNGSLLNELIRITRILIKEPRLDPWLARVLITELLWGKQHLQSECKPVKTILSYKNELLEALSECKINFQRPNKSAVQRPRYVRVNTLLLSVENAISNFQYDGWSLLPKSQDYSSYLKSLSTLSDCYFIQDFHIKELFAFPSETQFHDSIAYMNGEIILQDKASCIPSYLLNPPPGSVVLDMCAAPGMKTSHIAAIMQNEGQIYAVELDNVRYNTLCQQMKMTDSYCVKTLHADALTLDEMHCPGVEYILVDPTCSGSGMLDRPKINSIDDKTNENRLKNLRGFQVLLLRRALFKFPNVKRVVYSTCSLNREENEDVIGEIMNDIGNAYRLVPIKEIFRNNWINFSSVDSVCKDNCLYARPEVDHSKGFFVALFERNFDVPLPMHHYYKSKKTHVDVKPELTDDYEQIKKEQKQKKKKRGKKKRTDKENDVSEKFYEEKVNVLSESQEISENSEQKVDEGNVPKIEKSSEKESQKKLSKRTVGNQIDESVDVSQQENIETSSNNHEICKIFEQKIDETNLTGIEETSGKKSRKKKSKTITTTQIDEDINISHQSTNIQESTNVNADIQDIEEVSRKKSRRKKNNAVEDETVQSYTNDYIVEEKADHKKRRSDDQESEDSPKKKLKKKKKETNIDANTIETCDTIETIDDSQEIITMDLVMEDEHKKKKKKSKKKKKDE